MLDFLVVIRIGLIRFGREVEWQLLERELIWWLTKSESTESKSCMVYVRLNLSEYEWREQRDWESKSFPVNRIPSWERSLCTTQKLTMNWVGSLIINNQLSLDWNRWDWIIYIHWWNPQQFSSICHILRVRSIDFHRTHVFGVVDFFVFPGGAHRQYDSKDKRLQNILQAFSLSFLLDFSWIFYSYRIYQKHESRKAQGP